MNKQNDLLEYERKQKIKQQKEIKERDEYVLRRQQELLGYPKGFSDNKRKKGQTVVTIYKFLSAFFFLLTVALGSFVFFSHQKYENEVKYLEKMLTEATSESKKLTEKLRLTKEKLSFDIDNDHKQISDAEKDIVVFKDSFIDNKKKWFTKKDGKVELSIEKEGYYFSHKRDKDSWLSWNRMSLSGNENFLIECYMKKVSGVNNYGYGLAWGLKDAANNYHFQISGDGHYSVTKFQKGSTIKIISWKRSEHINRFDSRNKISVRRYGAFIHFYINDKWVDKVPFEPFMGNKVGFKIDHRQAVTFSKLIITKLLKRKPLLSEKFLDNRNNWALKRSSDVILDISKKSYHFFHKRPDKSWLSWKDIDIDSSRDFIIESDMVKVSGINNNGYGIVFGLKNSGNCYFFQISGDGHYRFYKSFEGRYQHIIPWTKTKYVNRFNSSNKLTVKKRGRFLNFYINNSYVDSSPFLDLMGKGVGFRIDMNQEIRFKNLIVSEI